MLSSVVGVTCFLCRFEGPLCAATNVSSLCTASKKSRYPGHFCFLLMQFPHSGFRSSHWRINQKSIFTREILRTRLDPSFPALKAAFTRSFVNHGDYETVRPASSGVFLGGATMYLPRASSTRQLDFGSSDLDDSMRAKSREVMVICIDQA